MKMNANTQIRMLLLQKGLNISKLAELLSQKTGKPYSRQNLSNKLRGGTIRYDEMLIIADILGYNIKFEENNKIDNECQYTNKGAFSPKTFKHNKACRSYI